MSPKESDPSCIPSSDLPPLSLTAAKTAETTCRCGVVALVGRPNVGKSSLVNALLGMKVAVVSPKPQTTRNAVRCIYNDDDSQIIFVDTPGLHPPRNKLGRFLAEEAENALRAADVVCWLVEAGDRKLWPEDMAVLRALQDLISPTLLLVNKTDLCDPGPAFELYARHRAFAGELAISTKKRRNLKELIALLLPLLPEGDPWYAPDILMDTTERFLASEIIRGWVLSSLQDEVPHCVAVEINEYKSPEDYPERRKLYIRASLIVETPGQKAIVIGAGGRKLKQIGQGARRELEVLTGWPVYLDLWVKLSPGWRQSEPVLRRLGYR
ncbi:MAG: GTPase Era [Fretibacterium sp.]|nr:GTPase Era [Fretibacterium sp.]